MALVQPHAEPAAGVTPLNRPVLYDVQNQRRSEHLQVRTKLLREDFEAEQIEWMEEVVGVDVAQIWGPPDTSLNPLASSTKQLVTPGLYGRRPTVTAPEDGDGLTGSGGYMDAARMWSRAQRLQYLVVGAGIWFRRLGVVTYGTQGQADYRAQLVDQLVTPADIVVFVDEANPSRISQLWHLRVRKLKLDNGGLEQFYAWDVWSLPGDGTGSVRVKRATNDGQLGEDVSGAFLSAKMPDGMVVRGALEGNSYPWKDPGGRAYLPWVVYRAEESEEFWPSWRKGMHRGTMRAVANWTYAGRSALFATGESVILAGPEPGAFPGEEVHRGDGNMQLGMVPLQTVKFHPNTITIVPIAEGKTLQNVKIGPGVNLGSLSDWASCYSMNLHVGDGLHPTDATRQSANPSSGQALQIQAESRREFSVQVLPLFYASDLETIQICSWLLYSAGFVFPADGYTVTYHTIALTPTEQGDLRTQLEWEEKRGQVSPIDVHLRLNPGKTPEQAKTAIIGARADAAELDSLVQAELDRRGVKVLSDKTNPFASVGLPALVEAGIIGPSGALKLLGLDTTYAPTTDELAAVAAAGTPAAPPPPAA